MRLPGLTCLLGRTPHGVRGLKYKPCTFVNVIGSRTPHGVRGLK